MSNKVLSFIITARDTASGVFRRIGGAITGLTRRLFSLPTLIGGSAIVAALAKVVGASMRQERANRALAASMALNGEVSRDAVKDLADFAGALQKITTYGDEATMEAMALGMNLGVPRDRIKEVTRAAMGLAAATGMDLKTAMMLFGREASGASAALSRYGIVIEEGLTQQERMNRLIEIGAERFGLAEAAAKGTGGAWAQLKNSIGDLWERIGEGVDHATNLEAVFRRVKRAIDSIDGRRISATLSGAWNLIRSLFDGTVRWIDVLRDAGTVIGLALKVGFLEAVDFLYKALRGVVTGATHALSALPETLGMLFRHFTSASYWSGLAKVIIGSLAQVGGFLMRIFTAPIAALGAGLDKVWLEFSNAMAKTRVGRWAGFEEQDDKSFGELYAEHRRMGEEFTNAGMEGSRQLIREGAAQLSGYMADAGNQAADMGRRFADGFSSEFGQDGFFDTTADRGRIGEMIGDARQGLANLASPSLLRDAFADAADGAVGILGSGLSDMRKQMDGAMEVKVGRIDLGDVFDAARGQDHDRQAQIAENTRQMVDLSRQILAETKQGGIS